MPIGDLRICQSWLDLFFIFVSKYWLNLSLLYLHVNIHCLRFFLDKSRLFTSKRAVPRFVPSGGKICMKQKNKKCQKLNSLNFELYEWVQRLALFLPFLFSSEKNEIQGNYLLPFFKGRCSVQLKLIKSFLYTQ